MIAPVASAAPSRGLRAIRSPASPAGAASKRNGTKVIAKPMAACDAEPPCSRMSHGMMTVSIPCASAWAAWVTRIARPSRDRRSGFLEFTGICHDGRWWQGRRQFARGVTSACDECGYTYPLCASKVLLIRLVTTSCGAARSVTKRVTSNREKVVRIARFQAFGASRGVRSTVPTTSERAAPAASAGVEPGAAASLAITTLQGAWRST